MVKTIGHVDNSFKDRKGLNEQGKMPHNIIKLISEVFTTNYTITGKVFEPIILHAQKILLNVFHS